MPRAKRHFRKQNKESFINHNLFRIGVLVITIVLIGFIAFQIRHLNVFAKLSKYGYLGIFVINFISASTVVIPLPGIATTFLGGGKWNPFYVGIASGLGSSIGELFGYLAGFGGRGLLRSYEKKNSWLINLEKLFHKNGFITILVVSMIPFPLFDFVGILAGVSNYTVWKFFLATITGRIVRDAFIAWSGAKILPY